MEKLEKILFYAFLFLIPFQIRATIAWEGSEWDSIFLYLTDLLLVGFLFLGVLNKRISFKKNDILLFLFLGLALISIFISTDKGVSVYRLIKFLEFAVLYIYVCSQFKIQTILFIIFYSAIFQSILAIVQFYRQASLSLRFIEAGQYLPGAPGVATFIMGDDKVMRAYGSFPHPNVLAGFLLLAIFAFYAIWLTRPIRPIGLIGLIGPIFALFLTFSRGPILVFIFMSMIFFLVRFFQTRSESTNNIRMLRMKVIKLFGLFLISCLICIAILFPYLKARFFTISLQEEAVDLRFFYNKMALAMIKDKPLLGVGIGNFVNFSRNYPAFIKAANAMFTGRGGVDIEIPDWIYQPVHNIYLLIASEIGILGAIVFLLFIAKTLIRPVGLISPIGFLLVGFLILALSDHYFWTLQSGGLMFWLALALART